MLTASFQANANREALVWGQYGPHMQNPETVGGWGDQFGSSYCNIYTYVIGYLGNFIFFLWL